MNAAATSKPPVAPASHEGVRHQDRESKEQGGGDFKDVFANAMSEKSLSNARKAIPRTEHCTGRGKITLAGRIGGGNQPVDDTADAADTRAPGLDGTPTKRTDAEDAARLGLICFPVPVIVLATTPVVTPAGPELRAVETDTAPVENAIPPPTPLTEQADAKPLIPVLGKTQTGSAENSVAEEKITTALDVKNLPPPVSTPASPPAKHSKRSMIPEVSSFDGLGVSSALLTGDDDSKDAGTDGAKTLPTMKTIGKLIEKSASAMQGLSVSPTVGLEKNVSGHERGSSDSRSAIENANGELTASAMSPLSHNIEIPETRVHETSKTLAVRLLDTISKEVTVVRQMQAERLTVVLRPDSETQLMLHLNVRNGKIEAMAQFEHGDFQLLNAHWSELQHSLEQQGVRLQPLQDPDAHFHMGHGANGNSRQPDHESQSQPGEHMEITKKTPAVSNGSERPAAGRYPTNKRLLESWA